jgi:hypothetical protein
MSTWKPWDTAPKDGREIIVRYPKQGNVKALVRYCTHHDIWMNKGTACIGIDTQECEWADIPGDEPDSEAQRLRSEVKHKVEAIHKLLAENAELRAGPVPCERCKLFEAAYMAALAGCCANPNSPDTWGMMVNTAGRAAEETVRQWPEFMAALEAE